jgi:endonuclease/exonuclease/phosphatase family metal-dependent hydrolase
MRITLATYNIHACVGADRRFDPQRTANVVRELDADVVALQEVEHRRVEGYDLLDFLAAAVGLTAVPGPILLRETGDFGNALLTRLPILAVSRIDLSQPHREPRGALDVALAYAEKEMQVVATHLGLCPGERRRQIRRLLGLFEPGHTDLAVLLGDLNEWLLWGRPQRRLRRHFAASSHPRTYPARFPLLALDRIWARPASLLRSVEPHGSSMARRASDHLPLKGVLDVEFPL